MNSSTNTLIEPMISSCPAVVRINNRLNLKRVKIMPKSIQNIEGIGPKLATQLNAPGINTTAGLLEAGAGK